MLAGFFSLIRGTSYYLQPLINKKGAFFVGANVTRFVKAVAGSGAVRVGAELKGDTLVDLCILMI